MDKIMDFPNEWAAYSTPEYQVLADAVRVAQAASRKAEQELLEAEKAYKRSPNKWGPIVVARTIARDEAVAEAQAANAAHGEYTDSLRQVRRQTLREVSRRILGALATPYEVNEHTLAVRIALAQPHAEYDLLVVEQSYDLPSFEVVLVEGGTDNKVFGYEADVRGPRNDGWKDYAKVVSAHASWGSLSSMDTVAKGELMLLVLQTAVAVARLTNDAFGLPNG
jgi:hypothetical protein